MVGCGGSRRRKQPDAEDAKMAQRTQKIQNLGDIPFKPLHNKRIKLSF